MPPRSGFFWADLVVEPPDMEPRGPVCVHVGDGGVETGGGCPPGAPREPLAVLPALCNGHLHVLDAVAAEAGEDLELHELVAHPGGLKYEILAGSGAERLREAASEAISWMRSRGVAAAAIYAELGFLGAEAARAAAEAAGIEARLLPQPVWKSLGEAAALLASYGGLGLDTPLDFTEPPPRGLGDVHVHVSEDPALARLGDLAAAAQLGARAAIHLTHVGEGEVVEAARSWGLYPVMCPRSNMFFQAAVPPVRSLIHFYEEGLPAALGTDNAAWIPPDPAAEMSHAYLAARVSVEPGLRGLLARALLYAVTEGCYRLLHLEQPGWLVARIPLLAYTRDPVVTIVKRLYTSSVEAMLPSRRL